MFQVEAFKSGITLQIRLGTSAAELDKAFIRVILFLQIASGDASKVADSLATIGLTVDDLRGLNTEDSFEVIRKALAELRIKLLRPRC